MTLAENIQICKQTRELAAQTAAEVLKLSRYISESDFCKLWSEKLYQIPLWDEGWYSPPPLGVAALFEDELRSQRIAYDNLRKKEFWPLESKIFGPNHIGYIYASPVSKQSGVIGDFGMTIYSGKDANILSHIKNILKVTETVADFCQEGMEFREIHNFCQKLMNENGLNNKRTLAYTDNTGSNLGHTVPWTHDNPTDEEVEVIQGNNFEKLKNLISKKRIHLNKQEAFKIPSTIAFTLEPRLENNTHPELPMASFHFIITFTEGKKEILGNFNSIFENLKMNINSNY